MMTFFHRRRLWFVLLLALGGAQTASAQDAPPMLLITIRDQHGTDIAGVQIVVRDRSGKAILGRAETSADGVATVENLPTPDVLLEIMGTLPNGVTLRLSTADAHGLVVTLTPPTTHLDLRITPDGVVVPDPTTMITLDPGVPIDPAIPTALPAPTSSKLATRVPAAAPQQTASLTANVNRAWLLYAIVAGLAAVVCGLFVLQTRWRREG